MYRTVGLHTWNTKRCEYIEKLGNGNQDMLSLLKKKWKRKGISECKTHKRWNIYSKINIEVSKHQRITFVQLSKKLRIKTKTIKEAVQFMDRNNLWNKDELRYRLDSKREIESEVILDMLKIENLSVLDLSERLTISLSTVRRIVNAIKKEQGGVGLEHLIVRKKGEKK